MFFRSDSDYPEGILKSFNAFCQDNNLLFEVKKNYEQDSVVKGNLYLSVSDADLWLLLKDCRNNDFRIGKDVGVLSFNDHIVKEIISGGITTISTDFMQMALMTAKNVHELKFTKSIVPTRLIARGSL